MQKFNNHPYKYNNYPGKVASWQHLSTAAMEKRKATQSTYLLGENAVPGLKSSLHRKVSVITVRTLDRQIMCFREFVSKSNAKKLCY